MKSTILTELSAQDIKSLVKDAINEHEKEKNNEELQTRTYTINQVRNSLKRSHVTIQKLVKEGILKVSADGRIFAWSLNESLQKDN